MEVGDDRVTVSSSTIDLAVIQVAQSRLFKMKTSIPDTAISSKMFNLAQVVSQIPTSAKSSWTDARKSGSKDSRAKNLGFLDDVHLRTILNVKKGEIDSFASTFTGKASFFRNRMALVPYESYGRTRIGLFLQDGLLNSSNTPEPKYMPSFMGGTSVPALFDIAENILLYMHSWKNGAYRRLYGTACQEAMNAVEMYNRTDIPQRMVLGPALRLNTSYLKATYGHQIAVPREDSRFTILEPKPFYEALAPHSGALNAESILVKTRRVCSRRVAEIEYERFVRDSEIIFGKLTVEGSELLRRQKRTEQLKKYNGALRASSAFNNLINREADYSDMETLAQEGFKLVTSLVRDFDIDHARSIKRGFKGCVYGIQDLKLTEDMFLWEEVASNVNMKVSGIKLNFIGANGYYKTKTTDRHKIGLFEVSDRMKDWADHQIDILKNLRVGQTPIPWEQVAEVLNIDRTYVSDDSPLIAEIHHDRIQGKWLPNDSIAMLTDDLKLCRHIARYQELVIVRVNPLWYLNKLKEAQYRVGELSDKEFFHMFGRFFVQVWERQSPLRAFYCDTGSLLAYTSKLEEVGGNRGTNSVIFNEIHVQSTGWNTDGKRFERVKVEPKKWLSTTHWVNPGQNPRVFPNDIRARDYKTVASSSSSRSSSARLSSTISTDSS